jgi:hypothetical protein
MLNITYIKCLPAKFKGIQTLSDTRCYQCIVFEPEILSGFRMFHECCTHVTDVWGAGRI